MGKFGKNRLPKFLEKGQSTNGANPRANPEHQVSEMGGHDSSIVQEFIDDMAQHQELWTELGFSHDANLEDIVEYIEEMSHTEFFEMREEFNTLKNMHAHMKNGGRINECWQPMSEDYVPGLSDSAKLAIKRMCEAYLIHEAHGHDMTPNESQNYASYMNECYQYMTECMMRAAQNLKV